MLGKITLSSFLYNPGLVLDCERIFGRRPKVKPDDSLIPLSETLAQIAIIRCFEHYKDRFLIITARLGGLGCRENVTPKDTSLRARLCVISSSACLMD